jgi:hypothetical protein
MFISNIADNLSQHAHPCFKHYSSSWANVLVGKCLSGQMSFGANVFLGRCPSGQMSFWANVLLGKNSSGQVSSGQMSFWATVFLGVHRRYIPYYSCAQARRPGPPCCSPPPLIHPTSSQPAQGSALAAHRTRSREERSASFVLSNLASCRYAPVSNTHLK